MKTAEEVTDRMEKSLDRIAWGPMSRAYVIRMLNEFAEERVKEEIRERLSLLETVKMAQARTEALEEAAKVAEIWVIWTPEHVQQFIRKIRSLKSEGK